MNKNQLQDKIKIALKDGDKASVTALKMVLNELIMYEKSLNRVEINEDIINKFIKKVAREFRETSSFFKARGESGALEIQKAEILEKLLPEDLSEDKILDIIEEVIKSGLDNKGKIIGAVCKKVGNSFDKSKIPSLVSKYLEERN